MLIEITYNVTDVYMSTTETPIYVEISFEQPGGAAAVWGSITGTLSDQTDLQNALNAKLDEFTIDGGTEGQILSKASATDFDFAWINNYAKYLATNVRNQTGSTIGAFQVVYISGATGNKPLISLADADTEATSSKTYGVTATAIANNGTGDVVTVGELSGIDTSAFNEGDLLWLSTTAGAVVTTPPAEPAHAVFIGYVVRSHPTLGTIDVSIQNGYELNELHGVQITTPTDNQGLFYNSTSTLWENKSITTALGYTPVPTTRNITINGVTYDLSADRTWTISTGISGSGASGQVTYWTGTSAVSGSNNLFWDATNNRLGIGTNAPAYTLHMRGARFYHTGTTSIPASTFYNILDNANLSNNSYILFGVDTDGTVTGFPSAGAYMSVGKNGTGTARALILHNYDAQPIIFANSNTERARFTATTGSLLLGNTSDNGQRLQVYGDTLLRGSGSTIATTALTVQNSSSTNLLRVLNDGDVSFGADAMYWDAVTSRLGIGTNAPISRIETFNNSIYVAGAFSMYSNTSSDEALFYFRRGRGTLASPLIVQSGDVLGSLRFAAQFNSTVGGYNTNSKIDSVAEANGADLRFYTNNAGYSLSPTEKLRIFGNGNVAVNSTSDLGVRFGVIGDTLLRGSGATSATTALTVQNSSSTNLFRVLNDGKINFSNTGMPANTSIFVNIANGYVNYGSSYSNAPFFTYQAYGSWESIGADSSTGTILAIGGYRASQWSGITLHANGNEVMRVKQNGQVRFVPLASAPASPQAGDVYYDSTLNKLRVYTTAWETITSI